MVCSDMALSLPLDLVMVAERCMMDDGLIVYCCGLVLVGKIMLVRLA